MDRVFLDANVLFSAAYRDVNGLLQFWSFPDVELVTSLFAVSEAYRNLDTDERRKRLSRLVAGVSIVGEPLPTKALPQEVVLPTKDVPILLAAIQANATHLLTGDRKHFGPLFETKVCGVLIQTPGSYFQQRKA